MNPHQSHKELMTIDYWNVSNAVRHAESEIKINTGEALDLVAQGDMLMPEEWRLKEHMHVLKFDIIQGDTTWRKETKQSGSAQVLQLIQHTEPLISMNKN